ncbi:MAG: thermonuclease family protein [Bacilli bacterium]
MKKILIIIVLFILNINNVKANEKITVKLSKCVDGDTAYFSLNNKEIKTRFLAIDTPESTKKKEPFGKEASDFTCNKLKKALKIEIAYEKNSEKKDKYNRDLVWVFVDDYLLQDLIISEGFAKVAYLYGDYKYTDLLKEHETIAKINKLNIWSDHQMPNYFYFIILIIIIILGCILNTKFRKKILKKIKKAIK